MTAAFASVFLVVAFGEGSAVFLVRPCSSEWSAGIEDFTDFISLHGRSYLPGTEEYEERGLLFAQRAAAVREHNCRVDRTWEASVNAFADRTPLELSRKLGWIRNARPSSTGGRRDGPQLELFLDLPRSRDVSNSSGSRRSELPTNVSWSHLKAMKDVKDQGMCGSCWAFASAVVLRAHHEIHRGQDWEFSAQELVSCVPNPRHCGGSGGCAGATAELAMDYVVNHGLRSEAEFSYRAIDVPCPDSVSLATENISGRTQFGLTGWELLPSNAAKPLKQALVELGPVAVSVSADQTWFMYQRGIMDGCRKDNPVINHAVVAVGYGVDPSGIGFWELQNSWGRFWGENGHIKLLRAEDEDRDYCGWDSEPDKGVACQDDNATKVWVCGMCGVLYDSVVPHFSHLSSQPSPRVLASIARKRAEEAQLESQYPVASSLRRLSSMVTSTAKSIAR